MTRDPAQSRRTGIIIKPRNCSRAGYPLPRPPLSLILFSSSSFLCLPLTLFWSHNSGFCNPLVLINGFLFIRLFAPRRGAIFYRASLMRVRRVRGRETLSIESLERRVQSLLQFGSAGCVSLTSNRNIISNPLLLFFLPLLSLLLRETTSLPSPLPFFRPSIYPRICPSYSRCLFSPPRQTFFYIYLFPKRPSPPATLYLTFLLNHLAAPCPFRRDLRDTEGDAWETREHSEGGRRWVSPILLLGQFRNLGRVLLILTE